MDSVPLCVPERRERKRDLFWSATRWFDTQVDVLGASNFDRFLEPYLQGHAKSFLCQFASTDIASIPLFSKRLLATATRHRIFTINHGKRHAFRVGRYHGGDEQHQGPW
jgi:hypothetical protein